MSVVRMSSCSAGISLVIISLLLIPGSESSCTFKSPSWTKGAPRVSLASSSHPNKVLVDWSALIVNQGCVDQYSVWVWKDGQQQAQGKKYLVSDKNTLTKMVDIEPCLYHNFLVELKPGKSTGNVRFNSATLPSLERSNVLKYLTVGYHKDPRSGQFDLAKASVKIKLEFLTFLQCIKHIEVSGIQIAGAKSVKSTLAASSTPSVSQPGISIWEPYGTGRQVGENGRPADRKWGYARKKQALRRASSSSSSSSSSGVRTAAVTTSRPVQGTTRWGYKPPVTTTQTPTTRQSAGWGYSMASKQPVSTAGKSAQNAITKWGPSEFTKQLLRMKETPSKKAAGPIKSSPPFKNEDVEIIIPVEPCKEYQFEMKIVSPQNAVVGKISDIFLLALSDLPGYIPPPLTSVIEVKFLGGGRQTVVAQNNSPVPEACLLDYLEAVDTFANRVEHVANELHSATSLVKQGQDKVQDNVEMTQSENLSKLGCVCSSPRLEVSQGTTDMQAPEFAGVYLYQGIHQAKPYFKLDLEDRSIPGASTPTQAPVSGRRKRFIGRVDGGGTTTTARPLNFGVPQGSYVGGSFSTKYPSWRDYLDISTQSPDTKYSNRYSGSSSSGSSSSSSSSYIRTSQSNTKGPSVGCPDQNVNLQLRRNAEVLTKVSSWQECARRCAEKASCQNWVWNHEKARLYALNCALMEGFGNKVPDPNSMAGRWDCNYKGSSGIGGSTVGARGGISGGGVSKPAGVSSVPVMHEVKPRFLYWDPKSKQWLISGKVGEAPTLAEVTSLVNSGTVCPADNPEAAWKAKSGGQGVRVVCSPGL